MLLLSNFYRDSLRICASGCIIVCVFLLCRDAYADQTLHDSLFELRSQIQGYKTRIEESSQEVRSLQDAVLLIETRKKKLSLEKSLTQFSIADTGQRSADIDRKISEYMKRIARERGMLAELLRDIDTSQKRRVHLVLSASNFSSFFDTVHSTELVHRAVRESVGLIREEQRNLDRQKRSLQKQSHELILLHELELRQESALFQEDIRKKAIGAYTQKRGVLYQDLLRRAELASVSLQQEFFDREGVGRELSLAEAYAHAETLTRRVNIRPAFLLALVAQESRFGASQGSGNWKDDMEPSQWPGFLIIVQKLGLNPDTVPVSKKPSYGWGGAMGPAQFLPLTWLGYEDGIKELTGHALPSPWNIDDAFAGTALKLAQAGASEKTEATERKAALIYFAGENWDNPAFAFYADSILELAGDIEKELKLPPA